MKLTTPIKILPEKNQIDYTGKVLLLGSCFAENVGSELDYLKFQQCINPFGILFHPVAMEKLITRAINDTLFTADDVFFQNEQWFCFEAHSQVSSASQEILVAQLNRQLRVLKTWLTEASHIVFTFGTSWVYRHIKTDVIVANCHKVPQKQFLKELLSPDDVSDVLLGIEVLLKHVNPNCVMINTVSPVRHIKDGVIENSRSKAHLIAGVQEIIDHRKRNHYFPAYEIMMDELRDYRFYAQDMLHPNETAIAIIWEKFNATWIASETVALQKQIKAIQKGLEHRSFNESSAAHKDFKKELGTKISEVQKKLPWAIF
jgi:hypothetical protein